MRKRSQLAPFDNVPRLLSRALKAHIKRFPPSKRPKARTLPAWQQDISRAVVKMEGYSQEQLAENGEVEHDGQDGDEE